MQPTKKIYVILAEAIDRLSRDQEDIAHIYKRMVFAGVKIITLSEGEVNNLHIGLKGTMNALFLKDLADKTRRGLRGRVESGKSGGGKSYGYDVVKGLNASGEPITGEFQVNDAEIAIVRRVFNEFANGDSPRAIAHRLNAEAVPGPTGKAWTDTTIRGHASRGTGIINNELYIGRRVWNRMRFIKDPDTGKRVSRLNPESERIVHEVPALRVIDQKIWDSVKARQRIIRQDFDEKYGDSNILNRTHRPQYLLSGLLTCGICGGGYTIVGKQRYGCFNRKSRGTCSNKRTISRDEIETRVLTGLKDKLLAPEIIHRAVKDIQAETNRLNREKSIAFDRDKRSLVDIEKKIKDIVTAVENGNHHSTLFVRLTELEAEKTTVEERLKDEPTDMPVFHPGIADVYRNKVARLAEALGDSIVAPTASEAIRALIDKIILTPGKKRGEMYVALHGELSAILHFVSEKEGSRLSLKERRLSVVAGAGFEPATFRL